MGNNVFMRWRMNLEKQIDRVGVREGEGERKGEGEREGEGVGDEGEEDGEEDCQDIKMHSKYTKE